MAETYSTNQGLVLMEEGTRSNDWGDMTNLNLRRIDAATRGYLAINLTGPLTLSSNDLTATTGTPEENSFYRMLEFTGTSDTVTVADVDVVWMIYNNTGGAMTFQPTTGTGLSLADGLVTVLSRGSSGNDFVNLSALTPSAALTGGVTTSGVVATVVTNANLTGGVTSTGNAATVVTNANLTGGVTSVGNAATVVTNANLTGDVTSTGNAATVVTNANLTGDVTSVGNAATVVTNANLTGGVTSVGNAATVVTNANLTGGVTSVGNAATVVTNANLTGKITSVGNATTVNPAQTDITSLGTLSALTVSGNINAVGGGINLGATGADNLLDVYEEGVWVPQCVTGALTYGQVLYTKVGKMVTINATISNFTDTSSTAVILVNNLPFTPAAGAHASFPVLSQFIGRNAYWTITGWLDATSNTLSFWGSNHGVQDGSAWVQLQHADLTATSAAVVISLTYRTTT